MKKLAALICSIMFICGTNNTLYAKAEEKSLSELASELGADVDYLNIANFSYRDNTNPNVDLFYSEFFSKCSNCEAYNDSEYLYKMCIMGGMCMGISSIEVLTHNGVISPSDIQPDAERLCDVERNQTTEHYIAMYQGSQLFYEQDYYLHNLVTANNVSQQCDRLIETAEKCMSENKYFLIMYYSPRGAHAVAGIGITDGHWEFDGMEFDKCILTLDSNNRNHTSYNDLTATPFSEDTCIYINTESKSFYIPKGKLKSGSDANGTIVAAIDNDMLINYRGEINPSNALDIDFSNTAILSLSNVPLKKYDVLITDNDGTVHGIPESDDIFGMGRYRIYQVKGTDFHVEPDNQTILAEGYNDKFTIKTQRYFFVGETEKGHGIFDVSEKEQSVTAKDGKNIRYIISTKYNEGYYSVSPHFNWEFDGVTDKNLKTRMTEKGMLLSSDGIIETQISTTDAVYDENGSLKDVKANQNKKKITAYNDILLSFDEEDNLRFYIDPDKDGVFDTPVQKGDVNSDGVIDAVDASLILTSYANQSVENENSVSYLNETIADYDGNGVIDAVDASSVLTEYAMSSVS